MELDIDVGVILDVRHDGAEASKFIFSFEVDIDAMEEAGLGWATMFSFVYDVELGKATKLTSSSSSEVIEAQRIPDMYLDEGAFGTEFVATYPDDRTVYAYLSFELDEEDSEPKFTAAFDSVFFDICTKVFDAVKLANSSD